MANVFTPSGKVIPAAGNVNFNSNASSNAVRQVFGQATSNMQGLTNSNVDHGTRPPPYTALTVPTAASGNLKLTYFRGKSLFLTAPTTRNVSNITTTSITPTLSGGTGTSFFIAIGTSAGTSNTVGWRSATSGTAITKQVDDTTNVSFTVGSNYFISAYGCNATETTSSLAVSNTSAYGIPNPATGVVLSVSSLTNWNITWTAPSVGIAPTGYLWYVNTVNNTVTGAVSSGSVVSPTAGTGTQTFGLTGGTTYYGLVVATRPESSSTLAASSAVTPLAAPATFTITAMTKTTVSFSWTAVSGAVSYVLTYTGGTVTGLTGTSYVFTISGLGDAFRTCTLQGVSASGAQGSSSVEAFFGKFLTPTDAGTTCVITSSRTYIITVVGAGGGSSSSFGYDGSGYNTLVQAGGAGGTVIGNGTVPAATYDIRVGGKGLGASGASGGLNGGGAVAGAPLGGYAGSGGGFSRFGTTGATTSIIAGGGGGAGYGHTYDYDFRLSGGAAGGIQPGYAGSAAADAGRTTTYSCCGPHGGITSSGGIGGSAGTGGAGGTASTLYGYDSVSLATGGTGTATNGGVGNSANLNPPNAIGGGGGGGYGGGGGGGAGAFDNDNTYMISASGGGGGGSFKGSVFTELATSTLSAANTDGYILIYG